MDIRGSVIKVIPLKGAYFPKRGDKVIGRVVDIGYSVWNIDIKGPTTASLSVSEAGGLMSEVLYICLQVFPDRFRKENLNPEPCLKLRKGWEKGWG